MTIPDYQSIMLPLLKIAADGEQHHVRQTINALAELMFDYGLGVSTVNSYVVKRIDSDFFEDEASAIADIASV